MTIATLVGAATPEPSPRTTVVATSTNATGFSAAIYSTGPTATLPPPLVVQAEALRLDRPAELPPAAG